MKRKNPPGRKNRHLATGSNVIDQALEGTRTLLWHVGKLMGRDFIHGGRELRNIHIRALNRR